jgi:hypothetical protein
VRQQAAEDFHFMPRKKKDEAGEAASQPIEVTETKPKRRTKKTEAEAPIDEPKGAAAGKTTDKETTARPRSRAKKADAATDAKEAPRRQARKRPVSEPKPISQGASTTSPVIGFVFRGADAKTDPAPATKRPARERKPAARKPSAKTEKPKGRRERAPKPVALKKEARPPLPDRPVYEPIPTPDDAPRIVVRNGRPYIAVRDEVVPPMMFFGNPASEAKAATVLEEVRKAAGAGVHLFSLMIDFVVSESGAQHALDLATYLLQNVIEIDPKAKVILRLVFAGEDGWEKKYPGGSFKYADGTLAEPSVCDNEFWGDAQRYLGAFVKALRSTDAGGHLIGLHLDRGEWFFADGWGYDTSAAAEKAFQEWAMFRYNADRVALQASWFDGDAQFDKLRIPDYNEDPLSGEGFLRGRRKERRWVDYHLFLSDAMVERIHALAYEVKKSSEGRLLVGASYGYTFEWSHPASGHLSLGKLLRTREVDIIAGPPSYKDRGLGGAAAFPGPIDSFALNNKLFISEADFKTPISQASGEPDEFNPPMPTPQALEAAHWRDAGSALAHSTGVCWMDLWGNGWLNTASIWNRAKQVQDILAVASTVPETDPDVAVLIDERSLAYLSDARAFRQLVQDSREAVIRAGVSAGFYLLTDLAHRKRFPEAKLYIFLNAWDIRPEVRAAIKNRLQGNGKTLFWVYSAGMYEQGREALERVREVTGIAIRPQPFNSLAGTTILNRRHPLTELLEERALSTVEQLEPSYFAIPEEGTTILGEYTQTGLPSFVVREIASEDGSGRWRSVFLGEPLINEKLIRGLCSLAGVHVWNYHGDVVHARPPFLSIHYSGTGHRIATLPDRWHAYDPLHKELIGEDATHLRSDATDGASQVLYVGEEADVMRLSAAQSTDALDISLFTEVEFESESQEIAELDVPLIDVEAEEEPEPEVVEKRKPAKRERKPKPAAKKPVKKAEKAKPEPGGIGFSFRPKNEK